MKDPWGRWDVIAETTYDPHYIGGAEIGGCGKPVIYLYPTKPTEVKVRFTTAMQLDVQIPLYRNGWDVMAQPNGVLTDLLQKPDNCVLIDATHPGSEYASDACKNNRYPYLYWSGQTLQTYYPAPVKGFLVPRGSLSPFMNTILDTIGFTHIEKEDMLSYWIPQMVEKQVPYYRISFLDTQQVDNLFPMNITPQPDSRYRLFMDWEPLQHRPTNNIPPQQLPKIHRTGFFMLEWGGVHR